MKAGKNDQRQRRDAYGQSWMQSAKNLLRQLITMGMVLFTPQLSTIYQAPDREKPVELGKR
jgi:hypothetical protein